VILDADQRAYAAEVGESVMCDQMPWPPSMPSSCLVRADVAIEVWKGQHTATTRVTLCRVCAEELSAQLREVLDLLDARDVSGWKT
jgi:hypothetical protein